MLDRWAISAQGITSLNRVNWHVDRKTIVNVIDTYLQPVAMYKICKIFFLARFAGYNNQHRQQDYKRGLKQIRYNFALIYCRLNVEHTMLALSDCWHSVFFYKWN